MVERFNKEIRHRIMVANRGKNTSPEIEVRKSLFKQGFRYRIHDSRLPGKPDIVLPKYKAVIFIHGCFWHGHECSRHPSSKSNTDFWIKKIERNKNRDLAVRAALLQAGWRELVIWECAIRRRSPSLSESQDFQKICKWILNGGRIASVSEDGFEG